MICIRLSGEMAAATLFILIFCLKRVHSSHGDTSYVYKRCLKNCSKTECIDEKAFTLQQPLYLRMFGWTCYAECQHSCMWRAVDAFVRDGVPVPQFHGKWPFVRIFGIQEPASVVFSILNALGHLMLLQYRKKVSSSTPMFYVWHGLALVSVNAWIWSTIYHARDTEFTEMMDYFFALSIVMYGAFSFWCRAVGTDKWWKPAICASILVALFIRHTHYLAFVHFDYGYNMKFNIATAMMGMFGWLFWCFANRKKHYVRYCALSVLGVHLSLLLEVLDFPPLFWTLDAHALWHACTAPLNLLWWKFIIHDGIHLQEQEEAKKSV